MAVIKQWLDDWQSNFGVRAINYIGFGAAKLRRYNEYTSVFW
jgi:hypothetical protein